MALNTSARRPIRSAFIYLIMHSSQLLQTDDPARVRGVTKVSCVHATPRPWCLHVSVTPTPRVGPKDEASTMPCFSSRLHPTAAH